MDDIKYAIITAAGTGSRLGMNIPKCLVSVNHKKLIDYQLELLAHMQEIRIVVGYMKNEVMNYVGKRYSNVVFIENPDFLTTAASKSIYLATHDLTCKHIIISGDLLINPNSFHHFLLSCNEQDGIVGICPSRTEHAIYAQLDSENNVIAFDRHTQTNFEWCGIAYLNKFKIADSKYYFFEELNHHLPLPSAIIDCYEVDTPMDLNLAINQYCWT